MVINRGKHGWNGFVCKEDNLDRTLPYILKQCEIFKSFICALEKYAYLIYDNDTT